VPSNEPLICYIWRWAGLFSNGSVPLAGGSMPLPTAAFLVPARHFSPVWFAPGPR
jgi:hypothetical protein